MPHLVLPLQMLLEIHRDLPSKTPFRPLLRRDLYRSSSNRPPGHRNLEVYDQCRKQRMESILEVCVLCPKNMQLDNVNINRLDLPTEYITVDFALSPKTTPQTLLDVFNRAAYGRCRPVHSRHRHPDRSGDHLCMRVTGVRRRDIVIIIAIIIIICEHQHPERPYGARTVPDTCIAGEEAVVSAEEARASLCHRKISTSNRCTTSLIRWP